MSVGASQTMRGILSSSAGFRVRIFHAASMVWSARWANVGLASRRLGSDAAGLPRTSSARAEAMRGAAKGRCIFVAWTSMVFTPLGGKCVVATGAFQAQLKCCPRPALLDMRSACTSVSWVVACYRPGVVGGFIRLTYFSLPVQGRECHTQGGWFCDPRAGMRGEGPLMWSVVANEHTQCTMRSCAHVHAPTCKHTHEYPRTHACTHTLLADTNLCANMLPLYNSLCPGVVCVYTYSS